ncbi:C-C motif chemokine 3-like [Neoarius graeffei]|uniref:C-C motif chemokine 3-like n=1 Tax=Neoarius graeffei TaxID=443677 RepID=UPI00298BF1D4|nr:C-C motif chemokine 3-like [Neoarius graeffei]
MIFPFLLLGLACLQSFTMADNVNGPKQCCYRYHQKPIPAKIITAYKVILIGCKKPGVIFTLKNGHQVCADPEDEWVKNIMKLVDQL